jgi:CheY-like chemotaxis protein
METILVLCSDPLERHLVTRYLTDAGYNVLEASNSVEAARLARRLPEIHLVIASYFLCKDIGSQLNGALATIPLLLVTMDAEGQILASFLPSGFEVAVLREPFMSVSLVEKVREILAKGTGSNSQSRTCSDIP